MFVAIVEKAPKFKGIETGQITRYDLNKNDEFDAFCSDLINIGALHLQNKIKIKTDTKHELDFGE